MSPIRRFWVAWFGGWEAKCILAVYLLLCFCVQCLAKNGFQKDLLVVVFLYLLILPIFWGWRLRLLLDADCVFLCVQHVKWSIRVFHFYLLPSMVLSILLPLLWVGAPFLPSLLSALILIFYGFFVGFTKFSSPWIWIIALTGVVVTVALNDSPISQIMSLSPRTASIGILIFLIGVWISWKRLQSYSSTESRDLSHLVQRPLNPLRETVRRFIPPASISRSSEGRLPTVKTVICLGFSLRKQYVILGFPLVTLAFLIIAVCEGAHHINHNPDNSPTRLASIMIPGIVSFLSILFWLGKFEKNTSKTMADYTQAIFGTERLRPWSREKSAMATLTALCTDGLLCSLVWALGATLGVTLAGFFMGYYAVFFSVCMIPVITILGTFFMVSCIVISWGSRGIGFKIFGPPAGIFFVIPLILCHPTISMSTKIILFSIFFLLTLILVPLAWYRLAKAELP